MTATVRVSRDLYRQALADAIDWTLSLIEAGDPRPEDARRLARYRQAWTAAGFPASVEPAGRVSLTAATLPVPEREAEA